MIARNRSSVPTPSMLVGAKSRGQKEMARATNHYSKPQLKSFNFAAYSDESVKEALHRLFQGKCAYCETHYAASQPMDVEHFRPKSEIRTADDKVIKPGYWWLAAEWRNLLPSCIDCNRERNQLTVMPGNAVQKVKSGKETRFPLLDEGKRVSYATRDKLGQEEPGLLDPCEPSLKPQEHLVFQANGSVTAAIVGGKPSQRGEWSIEIYGLNRTELVRARQLVLRVVQHRLLTINAMAEIMQHSDFSRIVDLCEAVIEREMDVLRAMAADDQPFAQMVRQVAEKAISNLSK